MVLIKNVPYDTQVDCLDLDSEDFCATVLKLSALQAEVSAIVSWRVGDLWPEINHPFFLSGTRYFWQKGKRVLENIMIKKYVCKEHIQPHPHPHPTPSFY